MTDRSRRRLVRLWLIGLVCLAAGLMAHVVFDRYTSASSKVDSVTQAGIVFCWYALGLLLIALDLRRPSESGLWKLAGWIAWIFAALAGCCSAGWFMPS